MPEPDEAVLASEEDLATSEGGQKPCLDSPAEENDEKGAGPMVGDGDVKKDQGQSSSEVGQKDGSTQERTYYSGPRFVQIIEANQISPPPPRHLHTLS